MGTNYYIAHDNPADEHDNHIGKYSAGWRFSFQGAISKTIKEWEDRLNGAKIVNEYGREVATDEFWKMVHESIDNKWTMRSYALEQPARSSQREMIAEGFLKGDYWEDAGFCFGSREFC